MDRCCHECIGVLSNINKLPSQAHCGACCTGSGTHVHLLSCTDCEYVLGGSTCLCGVSRCLVQQVGVAEKGSAFPVWVRGQGVIRLRTASCSPTDVVRLTAGAEVIVAPRPRPRLDGSRPLIPWASSEHTASGDAARQQSSASIRWLRVQVWAPLICAHVCS